MAARGGGVMLYDVGRPSQIVDYPTVQYPVYCWEQITFKSGERCAGLSLLRCIVYMEWPCIIDVYQLLLIYVGRSVNSIVIPYISPHRCTYKHPACRRRYTVFTLLYGAAVATPCLSLYTTVLYVQLLLLYVVCKGLVL
ncbi:hypothetical protein J6590_006481 [Homalodisca vitripennis]|nr:hypothetical protein J6590_006481 [Homalodisca vitripennis]